MQFKFSQKTRKIRKLEIMMTLALWDQYTPLGDKGKTFSNFWFINQTYTQRP
jgi:hypothetical protein